jgi:hypothetical protein
MAPVFKSMLTNRPLQIVLIAAALLGVVYWYGRRSRDDKSKYDHELPNSGSGIPQNWNPETRAAALNDVMDGLFTPTADKEAEWFTCLQLTNDQLVAVYSAFNRMYCADDDETLTTWIKSETGAFWGSVKQQLVNRLVSLNCQ